METNHRPSFVPERFTARAASHPDGIAVVHGERRLSYAELEQRANQLSHHLLARGVGRGSVVVLALERSIDLIVSLLATWKAGATYLPVEPDVPDHRVMTFVKETDCAAILTRPGEAPRFADFPVPTVALDERLLDGQPHHPPATVLEGADAAYVIYTSGSTGTPKGVRVDHASLAYLCGEINERYGIGTEDRVLQFAAISFDTSLEQILVALLNGATLVLPDFEWAPSELPDRLRQYDVTVMDLTPPYWRAFLTELARTPDAAPPPVRLTIVGGSAVQAEDCRTALRLMPDSRLVNAYGLTETTITSCTMEITGADLPENGPAPVGRPLPGTVVHVLDERLRPVAEGERGEVHLAGRGVAHGYLAESPDSQRFSADPTEPAGGRRMFRTGDLGRWRADGSLQILGRADRQVKVRGFRIEPAEIEAALSAHELIADVAVKPYAYRGETQIAAYFTTRRADVPTPEARDLRTFVAGRLPSYMIPATCVPLAALPVKTNGKVDLDALPEPEQGAAPATLAPAPRGGASTSLVERAVAGLWCQVLDTDHVAPHDNFFDLGGDSLLAAELLAKVRATLGVMITQVRPLIRLLLEDATLGSFARAVESARAGTLTDEAGGGVDLATETAVNVPLQAATPSDPPSWREPAHVLLTGATGFLGVYLLRELLTTTDATVHCLVRSEDADHAMGRLTANARHYFGDDLAEHRAAGRIAALPGDLAKPLLGLSEEKFDALARVLDVIHHPGGLVNFIYPYSHMRAANVEGTREIIRLAGRYRNVPVHYTSTMAVVSGFGTAGVRHVTETTPAAHFDHLSVGYVESKWVAEALLKNAAREGLPVAIYRAADISGDRERGAWNTSTEMCAMKKFIVDTGTAPLAELPLDYTPVDVFAAAVAHIAASSLPRGEVYHLTNPGKVNVSLLTERLRAHGHPVREVPWEEWLDQVVAMAVDDPGHPMTPFAPLFIDRCSTGAMSVAEMYLETTFPAFTRDNVDAALADSGIEIPPVDAEMLDRYIRYLTDIDFL